MGRFLMMGMMGEMGEMNEMGRSPLDNELRTVLRSHGAIPYDGHDGRDG